MLRLRISVSIERIADNAIGKWSLMKAWHARRSLKHALAGWHDSGVLAQISTGEEGYTTGGGNNMAWYDNGSKGMDFKGNLELVDFATVHLCEHPLKPCQSAYKQCIATARH